MSVVGLVVQFSSEMCEALRLCLAQLLMCNMSLHQFEVLRLMSSACVVFLCVGVWLLEWRRFVEQRAWQRVLQHPLWYLTAGVQPCYNLARCGANCRSEYDLRKSLKRCICSRSVQHILVD